MDFFGLVRRRESCRAYLPQKVEREKLIACVEAARLAPSACNSQPWHFVVVDDPAMVPLLPPLLQDKIIPINRFTAEVPAFIVVVEENANLSAKLGGRFKNQEFASVDLGLAVSQLCLAATSQGLGTCILGWFNEKALKDLLKIPRQRRVRLVVAIGYPTEAQPRVKNRKTTDEIVGYNHY